MEKSLETYERVFFLLSITQQSTELTLVNSIYREYKGLQKLSKGWGQLTVMMSFHFYAELKFNILAENKHLRWKNGWCMSYCPATTSITILSLYNFCLQSNKLLLNSLHSLEIGSTSVCATHCLEMLSTQIFHTRGTPGWELTAQHRQTPTVDCRVTGGKNYGLNLRAAIAYNITTAPQLSPIAT